MIITVQAWMEPLESYLLEVIYGGRQGIGAAVVRLILRLLSKVFDQLVKLRHLIRSVRKWFKK